MNRSGESSSKLVVVLLIAGVVGLIVCCGGGLFFFGWFGLDVFTTQVRNEVRDHPVIVEHIGAIQEFEHDLTESAAEPGEDVFVFHIVGDKGSGMLRAECITVDADREEVPSGELIMDSGESYQLYPDNPLE